MRKVGDALRFVLGVGLFFLALGCFLFWIYIPALISDSKDMARGRVKAFLIVLAADVFFAFVLFGILTSVVLFMGSQDGWEKISYITSGLILLAYVPMTFGPVYLSLSLLLKRKTFFCSY